MRARRTKAALWLLGIAARHLLGPHTNTLSLAVRDSEGDDGETFVTMDRRWSEPVR